MKNSTLFLLLIFVASVWQLRAGDLIDSSFVHHDSIRTYKLYVPADYTGDEAWPLVIVLHGYALNAEQIMAISGMNNVADNGHFLVVYPQGLSVQHDLAAPPLPPSASGWNLGAIIHSNNDDVGFISQLIDEVNGLKNIDLNRVYACGLSNGAFMVNKLACELSGKIAAGASVSSLLLSNPPCEPQRPISMLYMNGTADPLVPFNGIPGIAHSAPASIDFWLTHNTCDHEPIENMLPDVVSSDSSTVTLKSYNACEADTEVAFYQIENGGHDWPGSPFPSPPFLGFTNQDISASVEIWNFFQDKSLLDPGDILFDTIVHNGLTRTYILYVPGAYDGTEEWPLVLNMHGYASSAEGQMVLSDMNVVADTGHFLVAYPQGTLYETVAPGLPLPPGGLGFNTFIYPEDTVLLRPLAGFVDDVDFIRTLIDDIETSYAIDAARVFATGYSNGGMMSNLLACELSNRIAAIAPVGSTPRVGLACSPPRQIPVLQIHGTADPVIPYETGFANGVTSGVPAYLEFWRDFNACDSEPMVSLLPDLVVQDSSSVELHAWENCGQELLHYKVINGGHTWPGGTIILPPFLGHFNFDFNASAEIWNFFNRNAHPNPVAVTETYLYAERLRVYPNPFSYELNIELELMESQTVQLQLFNVLGQPLGGIVQQSLPAGLHRIPLSFNGPSLQNGIYYLRLSLNGKQFVRPVIFQAN